VSKFREKFPKFSNLVERPYSYSIGVPLPTNDLISIMDIIWSCLRADHRDMLARYLENDTVKSILPFYRDEEGQTAVHICSLFGSINCLDLLLKYFPNMDLSLKVYPILRWTAKDIAGTVILRTNKLSFYLTLCRETATLRYCRGA
jgi:hypothetical protein